jgi:hypothetical protein
MTGACVSELMIDRLLAGELAADTTAQIRAHTDGCASCGRLLRDAEAVARRFAAAPPPLQLDGTARPARPVRAGAVAAAVACAAAVAIVVAAPWRDRRASEAGPGAPGVQGTVAGARTKGAPSLGVFISHGGELRRAEAGEAVAPGDRLQLVTSSERAAWIAVSAVDGVSVRTVYAPPQPLAAGRERPLPFSIILDATRGTTTITAVFCPERFALDQPPADCTSDAIALEVR